jgi:hypothetical protein
MRWLVSAVAALMALLFGIPDDVERVRGFTVQGTTIVDPYGKPFVPVGMNLMGPDGFFNAQAVTAGHADVVARAWRANTVRLNACLPEGCPYTGVHNENNDDLDAIVEEYTEAGLVVMIALHQVEPGTWPDDATLDRMAAWWRDIATRYGDEPRVWFNLLNEPGSDKPVPRRWLDVNRRLLDAVRSTGATNLVVVDGSSWGQEAGGRCCGAVKTGDSAILSYGTELKRDDDRLAFSFHVYDQWGEPTSTDAERDARMADYIDRVHAAGHALLIGELGGHDDLCCDPRALATQSAYRVAPPRGVGILAWHGQSVDDNLLTRWDPTGNEPSDIDDWEDPTNLTWQGRLLWDLAHR